MNDKALTVIQQVRAAITREETAAGIRATLPSTITFDHFKRVAETAIQTSPFLQECTPASLIASCVKCAEMGLLPDGREAAIVHFRTNAERDKRKPPRWETRAQVIPMIAGLRKHVQQSGVVQWWKAAVVREGDVFRHVMGDEESLVHEPNYDDGDRDEKPIRFFYAIAKLESGELVREVMSAKQVDSIRQRSKSKDHGPWVTDYEEMGKKTVMRRQYKGLPQAKDPAKALYVAKAVRALDEAMEVIEVESEPVEQRTPQQISAEKIADAIAAGRLPGEVVEENPTPRTRKPRKPAASAEAPQQPTDASPSAPPASGAVIDGEFEDFPGDQGGEVVDEPAADDQEKAFRRGWNDKFEGRPRTPPLDISNTVLRECFEAGWDKADDAANSDSPPRTQGESNAQLDAVVDRVFA